MVTIVRSSTSTITAQLRVERKFERVLVEIASTAIVHVLCIFLRCDTICDLVLERKILQFVLLNIIKWTARSRTEWTTSKRANTSLRTTKSCIKLINLTRFSILFVPIVNCTLVSDILLASS